METSNFKTQLSGAWEQVSWLAQRLQENLARMGRSAQENAEKLREKAERNWPKLRAKAQAGSVAAKEKMRQAGALALIAGGNTAVHLRRSQEQLSKLGKSASAGLKRAGAASGEELGKLRAIASEEMAKAKQGALRLQSGISVVARGTGTQLHRAQGAVQRLGKSIAEAPQRLREARSKREGDLRHLLANSPDALVVTDEQRRLVTANAPGLDLLGISDYNMKRFTMDAFVVGRAMPDFPGNESEDGEAIPCKIRRLDGGLRVAECVYSAEVLPGRNLYKFSNVAPYRITPPVFAGRTLRTAAKNTLEIAGIRAGAGKQPKLPRHGVRPA
jgi:PAS domain-containing protein